MCARVYVRVYVRVCIYLFILGSGLPITERVKVRGQPVEAGSLHHASSGIQLPVFVFRTVSTSPAEPSRWPGFDLFLGKMFFMAVCEYAHVFANTSAGMGEHACRDQRKLLCHAQECCLPALRHLSLS